MPFPTNLGMGGDELSRLASQATWFIRSKGYVGAALRAFLGQRVPGASEGALTWAIRVGRRIATAIDRANAAGVKATFAGSFRGNQGLSPGYAVTVKVTATYPDGHTRERRVVVPGVTDDMTVQAVRNSAQLTAQATGMGYDVETEGALRSRRGGGDVPQGTRFETEIVSIVASQGAP